MLKIAFIACTLLFSFQGFAQEIQRVEELRKELKAYSSVQKRGTTYEKIALIFYDINADSVCFYAEKCIQLGKESGNKSILATGYNLKGVGFQKMGRKEEKDLTQKALHLFYKSLRIREEIHEYNKIASSFLSIGNIHYEQGVLEEEHGEYDNAEASYQRAQNVYKKALTNAIKSQDSLYISKAYENLGSSSFRLYDYDAAIAQYNMGYDWCPRKDRELAYVEWKTNVLACKIELGHLSELENIYRDVLPYLEKYQQTELWINFNINYAAGLQESQPQRAMLLLQEADSMAIAANTIVSRIQINRLLYELSKGLGQVHKALEYYETFTELSASVANTETKSRIQELELKYNKQKVEKDLAKEQATRMKSDAQNAQLWWALGSALFLALGIVLVLVQRQRILRLRQKHEREKHSKDVNDLLKNQELESIEAMLEGQEIERKRIAEDLHDRLGSTLSATKMYLESGEGTAANPHFEKVSKLLDQAVEETRTIAHNLVSGILSKFGLFVALRDLKNTIEGAGDVRVDLHIEAAEERFHSDFEINVYRIVQEVFSNALKHADPTVLTAHFTQNKTEILLIVSDDGRGFDPEEATLGMGLKNIRSRVLKLGGTFQLDSKKGQGTSYTFSFNRQQREEESDYSR